jgi:cyanophycinase
LLSAYCWTPDKQSTAVWFEGGLESRLVDAYLGTRTEKEIRAVLDRGGLIAGTSAGATIQGSVLLRGSPNGNGPLIWPGYEKIFGFLSNVAIDQHVLAYHRACDLAGLIAKRPSLLGIGIDEGTLE